MFAGNPITDSPPASGGSSLLLRWIGLAILAAVIAWLMNGPISFYLDHSDVRKIRRNVAELKAGKTKTLHLIFIRNTDTLLEQIRGMPEIEDVYIEDTDITAAGMRHLGTLPNLKSLMAYNGVGSDAGMLELRNCTKLEHVEIYDRSITEDAIAELKRHIPNVRVTTKHGEETGIRDAETDKEIKAPPPESDAIQESEPSLGR
jgi:hypothetical protein